MSARLAYRLTIFGLGLSLLACGGGNAGMDDGNNLMVNGQEKDTGLKFETADERVGAPKAPDPQMTNLPAKVDLRSVLPPPGDQGEIGSCASWTTVYGLATFYAGKVKSWPLTTPDHQASPGPVYLRVFTKDGGKCDDGTSLDANLNDLVMNGTPSLAVAPYDLMVCKSDQPMTDAANFKIGSWGDVSAPKDRQVLKKHLANGTPLALASRLPDNFQGYKSGVFKGSTTQLQGKHSGHAMVMAGYDDAMSAFLIQNSWGPSWGDGGYVWWDYADFEQWNDQAAVVPLPGTTIMGQGGGQAGGHGAVRSASQYRGSSGDQTLLFMVDAGEAVFVDAIDIADPQGHIVSQDYGHNAFREGPIYLRRDDGQAFLPGHYELHLRGRSARGEVVSTHGFVEVNVDPGQTAAPLPSSVFDTRGARIAL